MAYIEVENISKYYMINHNSYKTQSFREMLFHGFWNKKKRKAETEEKFYALNDVSFTLDKGDVLGIVGRNGSGKSTLLKILSRITRPSNGKIKLGGKVSSLLEVGTGFHGELSGRENVYMNGVVLGMARREVSRKFDAIVSFAGVERFLDVPVKRYSSGMLLRLAFAVAAHLEPEILVIDEVLSVGDIEFQKKCLNVMGELGSSGRTILFVSHNIGTVRRLCNKGLFLSQGAVQAQGDINKVINKYLLFGRKHRSSVEWNENDAPQNDLVALRSVSACDDLGNVKEAFSLRESFYINIGYELKHSGCKISLIAQFYNADGTFLFMSSDTATTSWNNVAREKGSYKSICVIPANFLNNGEISVSLSFFMTETKQFMKEENVVSFVVFDDMKFTGARGDFALDWPSTAVRPVLNWKVDFCGK